jgi:pimeloyl-ACP methyl ester carboxylesterase
MTVKPSCLSKGGCLGGCRLRKRLRAIAIALVVSCGWAGLAPGQAAAPEKKLPKPEELAESYFNADGSVQLSATFYPPEKEDRETVPIILLHPWKGSRKDYSGLAPYLQQLGHAVLVPDLRGHGDSTPQGRGGRKLDATRLRREDLQLMGWQDMLTLRSFLVRKNDQEKLNLNNLCIVGAEMGATLAAWYALNDWTAGGFVEQGPGGNRRLSPFRDVKGLVLISPKWDFKGMSLGDLLNNEVLRPVSTMIVVGKEDAKAMSDANRLHNGLKRFHVDPDKLGPDERDQIDLFFIEAPTSLQGTKMLGVPALRVDWAIGRFIELRLVKHKQQWFKRLPDK